MWYTMPPWRMNKQCAGGKEATGLFYVLFSAQSHTLLKKGAVQVIMGYVWSGMVLLSIFAALHTGQGGALTSAAMEGAREAVTLAISMGGSLCLWSGVGRLMELGGVTSLLSRLLGPAIGALFPSSRQNTALAEALSGNITANLLGLGNAATPMGIRAAKLLKTPGSDRAGDELCRLIVLNTASIQILPATVAALRSGLGCGTPLDILPAVWVTSLLSAGLGISAAGLLGKVWRS